MRGRLLRPRLRHVDPTDAHSRDVDQYAELAALADGSLAQSRATELEREVAGSAELRALLGEQQEAVQLFGQLDLTAPRQLREELGARGARVGTRKPRARRSWTLPGLGLRGGLAGAASLAVLVAVLVLVVGGSTGAPSVASAAELGQRAPTAGAPRPQAAEPKLLVASVQGVPFPNWVAKFGWRPLGKRSDKVGNRHATTVFYTKGGKRLAYTIVEGAALKVPAGGAPAVREGTRLLAFDDIAGRPAVVWTRGGHTCVLSGAAVPRATMLKLAGWKGKGAVPF